MALFILGASYTYDLWEEVQRNETDLRAQREKDATLKEQLAEIQNAQRNEHNIGAIPRVNPGSRNLTVLNGHATVSWDYPGGDDAAFTTFAVEVRRLFTHADNKCDPKTGFPDCGSKMFTASDPMHNASRIPPVMDSSLPPGKYVWRVAARPVASASIDSDLLSEWSSYNSITVYSGVDQRIRDDKTVRVGTNLEQDSNFTRLDQHGFAVGLDVALIYALVEGCLRLDTENNTIAYVPSACAKYIGDFPRVIAARAPNQPCNQSTPDSQVQYIPLCVTLIPVRQFGDWQSALRHGDIDLFIGSLTKAAQREENGIRFSRGYLPFHTNLYVPRYELSPKTPTVLEWLSQRSPRRVGVIQASTNDTMLDHLVSQAPNGPSYKIIGRRYPSFPSLEQGLDDGEVDAVLIDETLITNERWVVLPGLSDLPGWTPYKESFLGVRGDDNREFTAIATMADPGSPEGKSEVLRALDKALSHSTILPELIPKLRRQFWRTGERKSK